MTSNDASSAGTFPRRAGSPLAATALVMLAALPAARFLTHGGAAATTLRLVLAVVDVGVLPGLLAAALVVGLGAATLPETLGVGFAATLAIAQVLAVASIGWHLSATTTLAGIWVASAGAALYLLVRRDRARASGTSIDAWIVCGLAVVVGVCLYMQSPSTAVPGAADAGHIAVIRRLAFEPRPSILKLYWAPEIAYAYSFPAPQFLIALVSRAADVDPLFVYQKIRLLWGAAALCLLYGVARVVFASTRVAFAAATTAAVVTITGIFGAMASFWGQLTPSSRPEDLTIAIVQPALLLLTLRYVSAGDRRSRLFFLWGSVTLAAALAVLDTGAALQFLACVGVAAIVYRLGSPDAAIAGRLGVVAGAAFVLLVAHAQWRNSITALAAPDLSDRRALLVLAAESTQRLGPAAALLSNPLFAVDRPLFFYRWFPVVLVLAPLVLIAYRRRPLTRLVAASLLSLLAIVSIPIVFVAYVYLGDVGRPITPVKPLLFLVYLLAGPLLLLAADAISRVRGLAARLAAGAATVVLLWAAFRFVGVVFQPVPTVFLAVIALGCAVALWPDAGAAAPDDDWLPASRLAFCALLAGVVAVSYSGHSSPVKFDRSALQWTFEDSRAAMADRTVPAPVIVNPFSGSPLRLSEANAVLAAPSPELMEFARRALSADAVLVHNIFNRYASPVFMPQQILMWPLDGGPLAFDPQLFLGPWSNLVRTAQHYQAQPFFNEKETLAERVAYMIDARATHVLLDPMYYQRLRPALARWPGHFVPVYDDGSRWAVFEFRP